MTLISIELKDIVAGMLIMAGFFLLLYAHHLWEKK